MADPRITKLKTLPPTAEAFTEHVCRAQLQTMAWKSTSSQDPPTANSVHFGWNQNKVGNLTPVLLPEDVSTVPVNVLENQMWICFCSTVLLCTM